MARRELEFSPRTSSRGKEWVVSDPVRGEYYVLNWNEFQILQQLRIPQTLEQLAESIRELLPSSIQLDDLRQFVVRLWDENLIRVEQLGVGNRLWGMEKAATKRRARQAIFSLLSIRVPGFNPTSILDGLAPLGRCLFHPATLVMVFLAAALTALFAVFSLSSVVEKTPAWASFTTPAYWGVIVVVFIAVKIMHELGHGLASRVFGGSCSEMGLMFLVFLPCMYCDVSETWKQPDRWKRAMVALAGVYVEVIIATICFWTWYLSVPGFFHTCGFSLMIITSVNTLLVNGNPLLRFDGYYVLSDLANVPNLAQVSRQNLAQVVRSFFFRDRDSAVVIERTPIWQVAYAVLSAIYRFSILIAILWAISSFFYRGNLVYLGQVLTAFIALIVLIPSIGGLARMARASTQGGKRWGNWLLAIAVLGAAGYAVARIPIHYRVIGKAHFFAQDAEMVYAQGDGQLFPRVGLGQAVDTQEPIATIVNHELTTQTTVKRGQLREAEQRLSDLQIQLGLGDRTEAEIEFWQTKTESLRSELRELERLTNQLSVHAQRGGVVIGTSAGREPNSDRRFFEASTVGQRVQRGELLCVIGDPGALVGYIAVPQTKIELIQVGDRVKIFVPHRESVWGTVRNISVSSSEATPGNDLTSSADVKDYIVEFQLDHDPPWLHGSTTTVSILGRQMTIIDLAIRAVRGAFFW